MYHLFFHHQISLQSKPNGRQKVKGGNGSITASISTSIIASVIASVIASIITLNLGVGCARVAGRFSDSEPPGCSQGAQRAVFLCSPSRRFSGGGGGVGSLPRGTRERAPRRTQDHP